MIGVHRSPFRGISTDFAEHRHYVQGDDTRHLDWKIYARSDRYYVKKYQQDTNLECRFLVDCSKSMFYKSDEAALSKFDYAATLVASLAYLLHKQRDSVGLTLFDGQMRQALPPRSSYSHFQHLTGTLEKVEPGPDTDLAAAVRKLGLQISRRGMVVLVSDFLDDLDSFGEGLGLHDAEGNEVILFHIEDPAEREFPWAGPSVLLGTENEGKLLCDPRDLRNEYLAQRERHISALYQAARQHGYMMEEAATDQPLDGLLSGFLNARAELFRR